MIAFFAITLFAVDQLANNAHESPLSFAALHDLVGDGGKIYIKPWFSPDLGLEWGSCDHPVKVLINDQDTRLDGLDRSLLKDERETPSNYVWGAPSNAVLSIEFTEDIATIDILPHLFIQNAPRSFRRKTQGPHKTVGIQNFREATLEMNLGIMQLHTVYERLLPGKEKPTRGRFYDFKAMKEETDKAMAERKMVAWEVLGVRKDSVLRDSNGGITSCKELFYPYYIDYIGLTESEAEDYLHRWEQSEGFSLENF